MEQDGIYLAVDLKLQKVGCVLLQAAMGGNSMVVSEHFDPRHWLTAPTPDLHVYHLTLQQALRFATRLDCSPKKVYAL